LAEEGAAPDPDEFAARYPDLAEDLRAALAGLDLVRGLVGESDEGGHPEFNPRLAPGRALAGYRIIRELGRGGMGIVYEAMHVNLERPVALKVLSGDATPGSRGRRRFLNEAQTAASLHHTHIVPVFDFGQSGGICYYAMQRIDGAGLDRVLRALRRRTASPSGSSPVITPANNASTATWFRRSSSATPIRPARGSSAPGGASSLDVPRGTDGASESGDRTRRLDAAAPFEPPADPAAYVRWATLAGVQAAEALAYAHEQGVIHRDVKPSNLLMDGKGNTWVADFGLARRLGDPSKTQTGAAVGTPKYMSPEQAAAGPLDARTDIYSLGATLYELLTLRPPFDGPTAAELSQQLAHKEPAPPRSINPAIPRDLETIVLKAMAKRPADRYARADDLADDLNRFLRHEPVKARRIGPAGRLWRLARRNPGAASVAAAAAIICTTIAAAYVQALHQNGRALSAQNTKLEQAIRRQFSDQARLLLTSSAPDRRGRGLDLLKGAAAPGPEEAEPAFANGLRSQAFSFLSMRDLRPGLTIDLGRRSGATLTRQGQWLVALSEDRAELRQWDIADGRPHPVIPLVHEQRGEQPPHWLKKGRVPLASVGSMLLTLAPGGRGLNWVDPSAGIAGPVVLGDRVFTAVFSSLDGHRLLTMDGPVPAAVDHQAPRTDGRPPAPELDPAEHRWSLWDTDHLDRPLTTWPLLELQDFRSPFTFRQTALAPDGKTVVTAWSLDDSVEVWSAEGGRLLTVRNAQGPILALAAGPDGLFATAISGSIRIWHGTEEDSASTSLVTRLAPARILQFSPDGRLLAAAGTGGTELWDVASGELIASLPQPGHADDVLFTPDSRTLAVFSEGQARFWTLDEPVGRAAPLPLATLPRSLAVRGDGLLALSGNTAQVQLWTPRDPRGARKCAVSSTIPAAPSAAAAGIATPPLAPAGVVGPPAPPPPRRDQGRGGPPGGEGTPPPPPPRPMVPQGPLVAFDDRDRLLVADASSIRVYEKSSEREGDPKPIAEAPYQPRPISPEGPQPLFGAQSPDRSHWALLRPDQAWLWRSEEPDRLLRLAVPPGTAPAASPRSPSWDPYFWAMSALGPDGEHLYRLGWNGELQGWRIAGDELVPLPWSPLRAPEISRRQPEPRALAVSPDGRSLAIGDRQGMVTLRDVGTGEILKQLALPLEEGQAEAEVSSLAFAPDGTLAVGTLDRAQLWSPEGEPLAQVPLTRGYIASLSFDPAGRFLAGAVHPAGRFRGERTSGGSIVVWDLDAVRTTLRPLDLGW
jgi:serine/threonine protein kinase/WD40 repeat protein